MSTYFLNPQSRPTSVLKQPLISAFCAFFFASTLAFGQIGTAFTYQGRLTDGGSPATGSYDMEFRLYDALSQGNQVASTNSRLSVAVSGGIFTVSLDFGTSAFTGSKRWLETSVRLAGAGSYVLLTPRQELTPTPNAIYALNGVNPGAPLKIGQDTSSTCDAPHAGSLRWNTSTVNLELCDGTSWKTMSAGFTVSGTISGLQGTGLKLQNNGTNTLTVSGSAFTFTNPLPSGSPYVVTVLTPPSGPAQSCNVSNGTGTIAGANITNVALTCALTTPTQFVVSGLTSPRLAGSVGTVTVAAKDSQGNTVSGYTGTVHFSSTDGLSTLPGNYAFTSGDAGVHFFTATLSTVGAQSITVTDVATTSITGTQTGIVVNAASPAILSLSGMPSPLVPGQQGNFTVRATDTFGNTATAYSGTVHFTSNPSGWTFPADYSFTVGDAGVHTFSAQTANSGTFTITATDTVNASITGSQANILVRAEPTTTTMTLTSGTNPATFGTSLTFTATITSNLSVSGNVSFRDSGVDLGSCTNVTVSAGIATCTISSLAVGSHPITARFNGTATLASSTSSASNQTIDKASTTVTVSSSVNPAVFGQSVTLTAAISIVPPGSGAPSGSVTFKDNGVNIGICATQTVTSSIATCAVSSLSVATHPITVTYNGDASFNSSTSSGLNQVANKASTTVTVASSVNPSIFGQSVTFTATISVAGPGSGVPSGSVTFKDNGVNIGGCATQTVASNIATCAVSSLSVATHPITVTYNGDASFNSSTSSGLNQVVNQASTTVTVGSSVNPAVFGQSVTFTATIFVVAPGSGAPSGSVAFKDNGVNIGTCTTQAVTSSIATCSVSSLSVATHPITATYSGDSSFSGSSSNALNLGINKALTTLNLGTSANPTSFGQNVTFTATISVGSPGSGSPTGTVTFKDNGVNISVCSGQTVSSSVATCTTAFSLGLHPITATYNADASFTGSTSNTVSEQVN